MLAPAIKREQWTMHEHPALFFAALLILVFGVLSKLAERSPVTGPMFFVLVGLLVGPLGLALFELQITAESIKIIAEITLIIILFTDASMIRFARLKEVLAGIPTRLLVLGLPLTMIVGTAAALLLFPSLDTWLLVMMALILSPTDAALGQAVIKSEGVPLRIRESISIESGLNDGIALPPILVCIAVLGEGSHAVDGSGKWLYFMAQQLTLGPIIGALVGHFGGKLVEHAATRGWMEPTFQSLSAISLALMSYAFAELVHGNGFIAAFFGGLMLGVESHPVRERIQEFGESQGQMLSLCIFLVLGLAIVPVAAPYWSVEVLIYALLSLTVIRMVPVAISLIGSELDAFTTCFVGWFGPRGIASVLYLLIVVAELGIKGYEVALSTIVLTVLISNMVHGVSAVPLAAMFRSGSSS
jgi:NhaP-type Na+/H+ or K+/H+ antiporter